MITGLMIDSREPDWVQKLKFDVPVSVTILEIGDIWVACDDGNMLVIERKTADDFLNSLRDERLFIQAKHLVEMREEGYFPYILVSGYFERMPDGNVRTSERLTDWKWISVQGALLTLQEMGIFVVFCADDSDLAPAIIRLGNRKRDEIKLAPPMRAAKMLGPAEAIIASIPGIGIERATRVIDTCSTAGWALCALTDKVTKLPGIPLSVKENLRHYLGLRDESQLAIVTDNEGNEILQVVPLGTQ